MYYLQRNMIVNFQFYIVKSDGNGTRKLINGTGSNSYLYNKLQQQIKSMKDLQFSKLKSKYHQLNHVQNQLQPVYCLGPFQQLYTTAVVEIVLCFHLKRQLREKNQHAAVDVVKAG